MNVLDCCTRQPHRNVLDHRVFLCVYTDTANALQTLGVQIGGNKLMISDKDICTDTVPTERSNEVKKSSPPEIINTMGGRL